MIVCKDNGCPTVKDLRSGGVQRKFQVLDRFPSVLDLFGFSPNRASDKMTVTFRHNDAELESPAEDANARGQ